TLHYVFGIHMKVTLPMYHIAGAFGFGVLTYYLIRNIRKKDISESGMIQMLGMFVFGLAQFIHLGIYYLAKKQYIPNANFLSIMILDVGCLFFVLCQLANYLVFITSAYAQRQEYASLTHLAYADGLTSLPNRARADKILQDLEKTNLDYCIISIDLNGLKTVNDEFGHPSGDKYIKDFAKVLTTTFDGVGFCARIGGDEFLVVLEESSVKDVDALLGRMNSALNVMNALYSEYRRSVATGYAFRHECPDEATSHEVYLLADQRMYELKRKMHEELGIHNRL
ncbi:MAG: GGDEF domain-containing protein, partial [Butyrivibrio sp.]|nr:GGDEF domain-containing protein [Butyrivibrio sp.]